MYKLLIVDDEYEIRNGLVKYFPWNKIGFQVVGQAENGRQAIDYVRNKPLDVMLCDIKLPFMSGIDVARELYNMKSDVKVVFLSAYREFDFAKQAMTYGVKDYVVKSATYDELIDTFTFIKQELDNERALKGKSNQEKNGHKDEVCADANNEGYSGGIDKKIINTIKDYVEVNYRDANLEDLSNIIYLSPNYISRYFKNHTSQNFSDYLLSVKMNKAAELLMDFQYKIYEVSDMVGYSNPKNFARAFKDYFGISPSEFRRGSNQTYGKGTMGS